MNLKNLKLWWNSPQILIKFKNLNCDKTESQIMTKLKIWKYDKTQIVTTWKTQIITKTQTQNMTKLKKKSNCVKNSNYDETQIEMKLKKSNC